MTLLTKTSAFAAFTVGAAVLVASPARSLTITTVPNWDGKENIGPLVNQFSPNTGFRLIGQTFTTGDSDSLLQDFSFQVRLEDDDINPENPEPVTNSIELSAYFRAFLAEFDLNSSDPAVMLYDSTPQLFTTTTGGFEPLTFNTGGVSLAANKKYAAFLALINPIIDPIAVARIIEPQQSSVSAFLGYSGLEDPYSDGEIIAILDGFPSLDAQGAQDAPDNVVLPDLVFTANLTAVPTPALLPGVVSFGLGVWRRRRAVAA
jgi:hypothetical protein